MDTVILDLWARFDARCREAEELRDQAIGAAKNERGRIIKGRRWAALARVEAAANARFEAKEKAAREQCERACEQAEAKLKEGIAEKEGNEWRAGAGLYHKRDLNPHNGSGTLVT